MNFPVWDVPYGLPLLIALVAIPHVFVSHFAIGGGLFLLVHENLARKSNDSALLEYVKKHSRFFMLTTLVFGALTGVGIWFTIGLISPGATSALIHAFVWFWATEWVMFFVEIAASLVYYYGWDRLDAKIHQTVMLIYFIAAWGSLAVINGIITFMLSSGNWPQDRNIWGAFFNPTYLPSLVTRTFICFFMAAVFAFITAAWQRDEELKRKVNKYATIWGLPSLALATLGMLWYYSALPAAVKTTLNGGWDALLTAKKAGLYAAVLITASIFGANILRRRGFNKFDTLIVAAAAMVFFGSFEWRREAARKPFVISNYMYSNGMLAADTTEMRLAGYTPVMKWSHNNPARQGEDLFRAVCASCHSLTGYNGLATRIARHSWNGQQVADIIPRIGYMRGAMPPWVGSPVEAEALADYLSREAEQRPKPQQRDSRAIWSANCGLCHTIDGHRPLRDALSGMTPSDIKDLVKSVGELSDAMPPFSGNEADAERIVAYAIQYLEKNPAKGGRR